MKIFISSLRLVAKILYAWSIPGLFILLLVYYSPTPSTNMRYFVTDMTMLGGALFLHPLLTSYLRKRYGASIAPSMSITNIIVGLLTCFFFLVEVLVITDFH